MIEGLEAVLKFEKPDIVLVVGDTNSTLAGAIAAAKLRLPLAHIEAGVRALDKKLPEQINRVVADSISDYFFCPSNLEVQNLASEGISKFVFDSGDVIYDSLRNFETIIPEVPLAIPQLPREFVLATLHRAEAVDNRINFIEILKSFSTIQYPIVFPIHPRALKRLRQFNLYEYLPSNIKLINPVGYLDILSLIKRALYIVTDSGGIQREAVYLNKHVIIARPETEWLGLLKTGLVKVVGYSFAFEKVFTLSEGDSAIIDYITRPASKKIAETLSSCCFK